MRGSVAAWQAAATLQWRGRRVPRQHAIRPSLRSWLRCSSTGRSCAATARSPCAATRAERCRSVAGLGRAPCYARWPLAELLRRCSGEGDACHDGGMPSVRPYDRGCGAPRPAACARPLHAHLAPPRVLSVADRWRASAERHATLGGRLPSCCDAAVARETRATAAACHPSVPTIVAAVLLGRPLVRGHCTLTVRRHAC